MRSACVGIVLLLSCGSALSEPQTCKRISCPHEVALTSGGDSTIYGLLLGAPDAGCDRVRYRVETAGLVLLGKTPVLSAGEVAVVRIGNGFPAGTNALVVTGEGCSKGPDLWRRVTLRKMSPDHGWRAALVLSALEMPDRTPAPGRPTPSFPWSRSAADRDSP